MKRIYSAPNPNGLFCALILINFLNYTDRAILPGSANEFIELISTSLSTSRPDIYLGFLQSSFIVGFCFASLLISHLVHFHGPFYLCATGLGLWVISTLLSGVGFYTNSFILLLLGRMLSGIGEASFVCIVPPWIAKHAPPGQKGQWLAIFYTALPVGTAFGYSYAAFVASTCGVYWAFFMESIAMIPLIVVLLQYAPFYPSCSSAPTEQLEQQDLSPISPSEIYSTATGIIMGHSNLNPSGSLLVPVSVVDQDCESLSSGSNTSPSGTDVEPESTLLKLNHPETPSMLDEFLAVVKNPIYICITAGIACQAAVLCGLGTFGSSFLMGLGYFDSETAASSTFGSVVCLAGVIGTPLGGILLDYGMNQSDKKHEHDAQYQESNVESEFGALNISTDGQKENVENEKKTNKNGLICVTKIITIATFFGAVFLCSVYAIYNRLCFLLLITFGCLLVFLCNPGVNIGIMMSVPEKNRSFAIALTSVCVHIFGDVPSPVITGFLKDLLAPKCSPHLGPPVSSFDALSSTNSIDQHLFNSASSIFYESLPLSLSLDELKGAANSDECRADAHGLRLTMLIVSLWLFMSALLFALSCYLSFTMRVVVDREPKDVKHLNILKIINLDKEKKTRTKGGKSFTSKRAHNRLHLQEPLLNLDEENL